MNVQGENEVTVKGPPAGERQTVFPILAAISFCHFPASTSSCQSESAHDQTDRFHAPVDRAGVGRAGLRSPAQRLYFDTAILVALRQ